MEQAIEGIVKSVEGPVAIIEVGEQKIAWPIAHLPQVKPGDTVYLLALSSDDMEEERAAIAKTLLNDVLSGST
ncbi:hypothetical protein A3B32_03370 [Candidatus Uhrbacteria bacterium RIFCSPLOWO2_01_FULL_53_9]|uniref:DUF3006 domain-containing protein n=3 Tax=Candidatus Uhriibacteriota TaxID=1752732 RepID=A0A1F7UYU1_9BACT|nr:MAG: hypothetical protein A3C17_00760 [Candidatus Uhrbacteria bacterium RIFCSPHIGHO2_02_FULL_53_13]OGL82887.1 MAG: hypothetical protein A3B32_03370 [Candidatus Uhrbacteria bacterium RIFCSPLOWO2_01_FULL_53_9]OGL89422.1 MAG: hypothetical protein A3I45_04405 [Candidatus Uhrbacteria bacterium RIFCSPLOWO2_02_FULL_53_10]